MINVSKIKLFDVNFGGALKVILKSGYSDYVSRRQVKNVKEWLGIINEKNNEYTPIYNIEDFQDINKMQKQTRIYIF